MNPFRKLKKWFIDDLIAKTDDVFERARIELVYDYTVFFFVLGIVFYGNLISGGLWYHFYVITFATISLFTIPFILKYKQSVEFAANWFVIQQTITSGCSIYIQEFSPDMSGPLWTISFIIFIFFLFGVKRGLLRLIPFVSMFIITVVGHSGGKQFDFGIPESQQLPNQPFVAMVPFCLCVYLIIVFLRTNKKAKKQISEQKMLLQNKNKEVADSINYAKRIQYAVLPQEESIYRAIPLSFILYKPKDIVSGDFFWFHEIDRDNYIIVCADCTGHGVPGAMMTVIGSSALNHIIIENKNYAPALILNELDSKIASTLKQQKEHEYFVQDGMDLSLLKVNKKNKEYIFTSAKRSAIFIRNKEMQEFKGSKLSLGGMITDSKVFKEIKMNYQEDDIIYFFTDGYTDQFGGPKGKKFSTKKLKETLLSIHKLQMNEQKNKLENMLESWKANLEQVDDILVIGIKF